MSAPRVLVVDDAELTRTTLIAVLARSGFDVRAASSVADTQGVMQSWMPDCLVLDRRLADGDGVELARELRAQPSFAALRIVLMSGDPLSDEAAAAADRVLLKPAGARAVIDAVTAALAN